MNALIDELQGKINHKNEPLNHELIPLRGKNCKILFNNYFTKIFQIHTQYFSMMCQP